MAEKISRSEQKRLFKMTESLAKELAEFSNNDLKKFPGEDEVKEAILDCRGLKGGARKRQIKYLAKVLRQFPTDEIYAFLKDKKGSALKEKQVLHEAERWRDVLINEAMEMYDDCRRHQTTFEPDWHSDILNDMLAELSSLNETDIRRTVYQYVKARNIAHYRELFRMIKAAIDVAQRNTSQNLDI